MHSYEAFTDNIKNVNWENIDKVIFVSENLKQIVTKKVNIEEDKIEVIPNGINLKNGLSNKEIRGIILHMLDI
ncbi:glycosyltransferase family 4 protein [Caloramator sp. Dgby_cultured_2]|uniref:glycosyltransferase family 4 protein n=1 Tax=Caloramator sp. Dgby_cultured_2 TaxID=3029174 RepID=UPI00237EC8E6|nr:glycosyltransferase family 4 protein [Caloramator sp. Dgby_cultured_2]WDU83957.1 glycosyltransferase family 4 protein [Caloramator sp. Dgby_cultured_2]